jgi:hypothetical protein
LAAAVAVLTIVTFLWKLIPILKAKWQNYLTIKQLPHTMGAQLYTPQDIYRATRYYVQSDCQSVDPTGSEEFRQVFAARQNSFKALDEVFLGDSRYRHTLVLADAGMGKSSLLINYYVRHIRSKRKKRSFSITLIPLGIPNVADHIKKVTNRENTVLFLDALDEDTLAIADHKSRLAELLQQTSEFRHVLITCRTQFFLSDEEIPKDAGVLKVGTISAGESRYYLLNKLYLSPFDDTQINLFLRQKFRWQRRKRKEGKRLVRQMGDLSARPMLLAHVDDLISQRRTFEFSFQIYDEMVEAWLAREERFAPKGALREFCELAAVNVYCKRETRKSEKISLEELSQIADSISPEVAHWQVLQERNKSILATRSLLNRDAGGNRKFSHRSIMEYLFIARVVKCFEVITAREWTDQMRKFWHEMATAVIFTLVPSSRTWQGDEIQSSWPYIEKHIETCMHGGVVPEQLSSYAKLLAVYPDEHREDFKSLLFDWQPRSFDGMVSKLQIGEERKPPIGDGLKLPSRTDAALIHWRVAVQTGCLIPEPGVLYRDENELGFVTSDCVSKFLGEKIGNLPHGKFTKPMVWVRGPLFDRHQLLQSTKESRLDQPGGISDGRF